VPAIGGQQQQQQQQQQQHNKLHDDHNYNDNTLGKCKS